jgi:hypothetical protein
MSFRRISGTILILAAVGCGQDAAPPAGTSAPAAAPATPTAAKPAATISLLEPIEGAMAGHIDTFRWSPVAGADGYVITIRAVTGDRVVWESAPMATTETEAAGDGRARTGSAHLDGVGTQGQRGPRDVGAAEVHDHSIRPGHRRHRKNRQTT